KFRRVTTNISPKQTEITDLLADPKSAIERSMALAFMMNGWSLLAADCKYLNQFVLTLVQMHDKKIKSIDLPSRHVLRRAMVEQHEQLKENFEVNQAWLEGEPLEHKLNRPSIKAGMSASSTTTTTNDATQKKLERFGSVSVLGESEAR